jgi:hypothetical protein
MNAKTTIAILAIAAITLSLTLSTVISNQAFSKRVTTETCTKANGDIIQGPCPGNSGTNGQCNTSQSSQTKAGQGKGAGEIKDSSSTC